MKKRAGLYTARLEELRRLIHTSIDDYLNEDEPVSHREIWERIEDECETYRLIKTGEVKP